MQNKSHATTPLMWTFERGSCKNCFLYSPESFDMAYYFFFFFSAPTDEKYSCSWPEVSTVTCDSWIMEGTYDSFLKCLFWFLLVGRCSTEAEYSVDTFPNVSKGINISVKNNCLSLTVSLSLIVSKVEILLFL